MDHLTNPFQLPNIKGIFKKPFLLVLERKHQIVLTAILLLGSVIRFSHAFIESMWADEALYAWCGERIFSHPGLIFSPEIISFHPPFFPSLIALAQIFFPPETAARVVSPLFGSLGILLIYLLGKQFKNEFVGLLGSVILTFHLVHIFDSSRIFIDATLTTFYMFLIFLLVKFGLTENQGKNIFVGLVAGAIILLKWSGLLVLPLLLVYYLMTAVLSGKSFKAAKKFFIIPLSLPLFLTAVLLINNYFQLGKFLPDISVYSSPQKVEPWWFYVRHFGNMLSYKYLLPFFIYGLWVIFKEKIVIKSAVLSWFLVILIGVSVTPTKWPRYVLPLIPVMLLIAGMGIDNILRLVCKTTRVLSLVSWLVIACFLFAGFHSYPRTQRILDRLAQTSLGYPEAGAWIRKNVPPDALIVSESIRQIRYYSGINYREFQGRLFEVSRLKEATEIASLNHAPLFLEVDIWESLLSINANRLFLIEKRVKNFNQLGFRLIKEIKIDVKGEIIPSIQIFKQEPTRR